MNQPKITKNWYEFAGCWLQDTRELGLDPNYTQLALAIMQSDENRPQDEVEYYMVLADNLKTMIDAKFYVIFDGEKYLTSTDSHEGVYETFFRDTTYSIYRAITKFGYSVWREGVNVSEEVIKNGYLT